MTTYRRAHQLAKIHAFDLPMPCDLQNLLSDSEKAIQYTLKFLWQNRPPIYIDNLMVVHRAPVARGKNFHDYFVEDRQSSTGILNR